MNNTKIEFELSTTETIELKRFLATKDIIHKDLSEALKIYIKKIMKSGG